MWSLELGTRRTSPSEILLGDIYHSITGEAHPLRPTPGDDPAEETKHQRYARLLREQRERLSKREESPSE